MLEAVRGLVLREVNYRDADKILTILTERGKLTASARGSRRKGSHIKAGTQVLTCSDFTLFEHRGKYSVNEADTVDLFIGLRSDIVSLSLGAYIADILDTIAGENVPSGALLADGLNALYALSKNLKPHAQIKAAFEFRAAALAGFAPDVFECAACGDTDPPDPMLDVEGGAIMCRAHAQAGAVNAAAFASLDAPSLAALRLLMTAESKMMLNFTLTGGSLELLCNAAERYLLTHLDRKFSTLDFYKALL